ncbi:MAG: FAD binding domain-containing protein, partial [Dokdonella sp.]|nr:FAD binding domain-containing protein [Dokdonella sp.]
MHNEVAFRLNGAKVALTDSPPTESLLRWLKRHALTGTKEGCADGDCGACTVAMVEADADGRRHYRAVNSCLLPLGALSGREVVTVEHLADGDDLHPVQRALVDASGSQCGYCTPGFVMSLFAGFYAGELDDATTEGNLCRCTGYAPIRRATRALCAMQPGRDRFAAVLQGAPEPCPATALGRYFLPTDIAAAIALKRAHPGSRWIAGATDLGVELSRGRADATAWIALDRIDALRRISANEN